MGSPWPSERVRETRRTRHDSPGGSDREYGATGRARRSSRRRRRSIVYDDDCNSDDSSTEIEQDAFDFSLEEATLADSASESDVGAALPPEELKSAGESKQAAAGYPEGETYNIIESLYTGEGFTGGVQQAKLTAVRDRRPDQSTFYRWVHRTDESMVLKRFETLVDELPGLDISERRAITKLFERVRQKFERQMPLSPSSNVQEMQPDMIQEPISPQTKPSDKHEKSRQLTWICVPFFLLREYQELKGYKSWEHPMRTILQYRFASVRRARDLQQAVCYLPGTPKDHCFRVAQLWCLILDNSFVATYAPIPRPSILGDLIKLSDPPRASHPGDRPKRFLVSYGRSVLWSFNVEECPTWFALMKNFVEFWPRQIQLFYGKKEVTPALYPKLLRRAEQFRTVSLRLSVASSKPRTERMGLQFRPKAQDFERGSVGSENQPEASEDAEDGRMPPQAHLAPEDPTDRSPELCEYFVLVYAYARVCKRYSSLSSDEKSLISKGLRRMDHFLSRGTSLKEQISYRNCPSAKYAHVLTKLQEEEDALLATSQDEHKGRKDREYFSTQTELFTSAQSLFAVFAPTELERPTVSKYWGAILAILQNFRDVIANKEPVDYTDDDYARHIAQERKDETDRQLNDLSEELKGIAEEAVPFKSLCSGILSGSSETVKIPTELVKAWLHIVIGLSLFTSGARDDWSHHSGLARQLIRKGRSVTASNLLPTSLTDHVVATPPAVAALIVLRFLRDVTPGDRSVLNSYVEYLRILESRIDEKPLKQGHQVDLARMQEEMEAIHDILLLQSKVCQRMIQALASGTSSFGQPRNYPVIMNEAPYRSRMRTRQPMYYDQPPGAYDRPPVYYDQPAVYYGPNGEVLVPNQPTRRAPSLSGRRPDVLPGPNGELLVRNVPRSRAVVNDELDFYDLPAGERKILPTDSRGYQSIISLDCDRWVRARINGFEKLEKHVEELVQSVTMSVTSNRERQDNAIYAFTIVTIIFLPLSTIAGIFGMNTADIRNMDQPQWLFWAVAVPLWAVVMVLCFIWSGEWERFRDSREGRGTNPKAIQMAPRFYDVRAGIRSFQRPQ